MVEPVYTERIDAFPFKHWQLDNLGYLRFVAPIARTGDLIYLDKHGQPYPEEVSERTVVESLDSFKTKAVTDTHPSERLTPSNTKEYARGLSGYTGFFDGSFLWLTGTVTDKLLIDSIATGEKKQISPGYRAARQVIDNKIHQIKRDGNHLAVVKYGRNGDQVEFKTDSTDTGKVDSFPYDLSYFCLDESEIPAAPEELYSFYRDETKPHYFIASSSNSTNLITSPPMAVQITLDGKIYTIEGNDAPLVRDALAAHLQAAAKNETERVQLTSDQAQAVGQAAALKTKNETLEAELLATRALLNTQQTEKDAAKTDTKEQTTNMPQQNLAELIELWREVTPALVQRIDGFEADYSLSPTEIKAMYLVASNDPESEIVKKIAERKDAIEQSDANAVTFVDTLYLALKPKENATTESTVDTQVNHADSALSLILNSKKSTTAEHKDAQDEMDYRTALTHIIESKSAAVK